MKRKSRFDKN